MLKLIAAALGFFSNLLGLAREEKLREDGANAQALKDTQSSLEAAARGQVVDAKADGLSHEQLVDKLRRPAGYQ